MLDSTKDARVEALKTLYGADRILKCNKCGYQWARRKKQSPKTCPCCGTEEWDGKYMIPDFNEDEYAPLNYNPPELKKYLENLEGMTPLDKENI